MTIFRWVMGVLALLTGGGAVGSFALFMALDISVWLERARSMRQGFFVVALFWFNTEIWGRVAWTLIHWSH